MPGAPVVRVPCAKKTGLTGWKLNLAGVEGHTGPTPQASDSSAVLAGASDASTRALDPPAASRAWRSSRVLCCSGVYDRASIS